MISKRLAEFFKVKVWFDSSTAKPLNDLIFLFYPKCTSVFIAIGIGSEEIIFILKE